MVTLLPVTQTSRKALEWQWNSVDSIVSLVSGRKWQGYWFLFLVSSREIRCLCACVSVSVGVCSCVCVTYASLNVSITLRLKELRVLRVHTHTVFSQLDTLQFLQHTHSPLAWL